MAQIITGIRAVLDNPSLYKSFQNVLGARQSIRRLVRETIRPFPGMRLLDIGCGPGTMLDYLPDNMVYVGFDPSQAYIDRANTRFGSFNTFCCQDISGMLTRNLPPFDVAIALSVLHHLDDKTACDLFSLASRNLVPGGRLLTIDPCYTDDQLFFARLMIRLDRGRNIRYPVEYIALVSSEFQVSKSIVENDRLRIPYTHYTMECIKK